MNVVKMSKTFMYFAYGSNLLAQRIHMNSPTAVRKGIGKLQNYRLTFNTYSNRWKGCSATVVPSKNQIVWGAIWEIEMENQSNLDKQEGVDQKIYFPIEVDIETIEGKTEKCRLYQQVNVPADLNEESLPDARRPSGTYLDVIIRGANESNLPEPYLMFLKSFQHNGYTGPANLSLLLDE